MNPPPSENGAPRDCEIAIVGAGFSGSMLAVHLAAASDPPRIALLERSPVFGPGLAYGTASREHLLNVPVEKMGAFPDQPDHFLNWTLAHASVAAEFGLGEIKPGDFLPRGLYGRYLRDLLDQASRASPSLKRIEAEVVDVEALGGAGFTVHLSGAGAFHADNIVLAWGNLPPGNPSSSEGVTMLNPWSEEARRALAEDGDVLIVGSGLTCLDLLATAAKRQRNGKIHILSRHGRFPQEHRIIAPVPTFLDPKELPGSVRSLFRLVRNEIRKTESSGGDWRAVIDSLRPVTQDLWCGLEPSERGRFLRHVKPLWEVLRHRAAPAMRRSIGILEAREELVRHRGRLTNLAKEGDFVRVDYLPAGSPGLRTVRVRAVINATGPEGDPRRADSPLLKNLMKRGLVRADPLGLGIRVDPTGSAPDDPLHTLGSLRRGALWESTAVPELRVQAAEIARQILASRRRSEPGHFFLFEI